jgi:hypothetical protein
MRSIVPAASAVLIALGGSTGALAQDVEVELYGGAPHYYYYEYTDPAPPTYGYRSDAPAVVVPVRPSNCGEFRYWNGERCVDARFVPPDVR